jgi:hypothetical protein
LRSAEKWGRGDLIAGYVSSRFRVRVAAVFFSQSRQCLETFDQLPLTPSPGLWPLKTAIRCASRVLVKSCAGVNFRYTSPKQTHPGCNSSRLRPLIDSGSRASTSCPRALLVRSKTQPNDDSKVADMLTTFRVENNAICRVVQPPSQSRGFLHSKVRLGSEWPTGHAAPVALEPGNRIAKLGMESPAFLDEERLTRPGREPDDTGCPTLSVKLSNFAFLDRDTCQSGIITNLQRLGDSNEPSATGALDSGSRAGLARLALCVGLLVEPLTFANWQTARPQGANLVSLSRSSEFRTDIGRCTLEAHKPMVPIQALKSVLAKQQREIWRSSWLHQIHSIAGVESGEVELQLLRIHQPLLPR